LTTSRLQQLQEMLISEPNDSFLNYALALEYAKLNNIKKSIEIIELLLSKDENYLGAYYQLGKYYEETEQAQKALDTYNKGVSVAQAQKNNKAIGELKEALWMLED
jgi:tetratricopeptide (TPR) repeat protein